MSAVDRGQEIELESRVETSELPEESNGATGYSLDPVDGGYAAWRMLLSAFLFESLLWGFPLSFGVFQNYYSSLPEFANQRYVSVIGSAASGISYMCAPIIIPLLKRFSKYRRFIIWFGWGLCMLGVLASSFARSVGVLILTQGVMYGAGFTIFYYPIIDMVNEYWIARRGMAYGLLCASSGVSGIVMPFSMEALLSRYGRFATLRYTALALAALTGPLIPFLKGRIPDSEQSTSGRTDTSFLKAPLFWMYATSTMLQGFGFFFPLLYIPSYASEIGLSSMSGALLLAIMSVAQVLGQFSFGYLSDYKVSLNVLVCVSTLTSAVAVFTLWGLARSFATLCAFSLIYGFFGGGYSSMWARMGTAITSDTSAAFAAFGMFNFAKGIGNVLTGPIGANLLVDHIDIGTYAAGKFEPIVFFTGSCLLASAASITFAYFKTIKSAFIRS